MKWIIKIILLLAFFKVTPVWSQDYKGQVFIEKESLRKTDDSLYVSFEVHIKAGVVANGEALRIIPEVAGNDTAKICPPLLLQSNNKKWINRRMKVLNEVEESVYGIINLEEKTETSLVYTLGIPFETWMDGAVLIIHYETEGYNNRYRLLSVVLAPGVHKCQDRYNRFDPQVAFVEPVAKQKIHRRQEQAFLDFRRGVSVIEPEYRRNPEELAKINKVVTEILTNKDVQINNVFVEGFASPDGQYLINERLSYSRTMALKNYLKKNFNFPEYLLTANNVAEDWDGLNVLLAGAEIEMKDEILNIIDLYADPEEREVQLMKLDGGKIFRQMEKELFPLLRRVEYRIDFYIKDYSVKEAKELIGKNEGYLSHRELYQVALHYGKWTPEFEEIIMEIVPKYYWKDSVARINASAVMLQRGDLITARRFLEKIEHPAAWNNLGIVILKENGNQEEARRLFEKAREAGVEEAAHNLKELKMINNKK